MSYFLQVELNIVTLLKGERHVEQPIHKSEYSKQLTMDSLKMATLKLAAILDK